MNLRIVLAILAIIPLILLVDNLAFHPAIYGEDSIQQMAFMILVYQYYSG